MPRMVKLFVLPMLLALMLLIPACLSAREVYVPGHFLSNGSYVAGHFEEVQDSWSTNSNRSNQGSINTVKPYSGFPSMGSTQTKPTQPKSRSTETYGQPTNPFATSTNETGAPKVYGSDGKYLGRASANTLDPESISNPLGKYGSSLSPDSINNPLSKYASPVSPNSVNNPLATDTPKLYGADGTYLGKISSNTLDPESISNPLGKYGSTLSPTSINNPLGKYGSPLSPNSVNNPFATSSGSTADR